MHTFGGGHHSFDHLSVLCLLPVSLTCEVNVSTTTPRRYLNTKDNGGRNKRTNVPNLIPIPVWTKRKTPELLYVFYNTFFKCTPLSHFTVQSLILFTTLNNFLVECIFLKGGRLQFKKIVISASQRVCNASSAFRVINAVSVLIRNNVCLPHASVNPYKVQSSRELSHRGWSSVHTHFDFTQS